MNFFQLLERMLPPALARSMPGNLARIRAIIDGSNDSALSQRTTILVFTIRIFGAVIAYAMQVLLARWIGDFQFGIYVTVWVAAVILGGFSCFGLQTAVIRFISEYQTAGDMDHLRGSIRGAIAWSFGASTILAAVGIAVLYVFDSIVVDYYVAPIFLAAFCLPMMAFEESLDGIARAFNLPGTALAPTFLIRPLMILACMALLLASGFEANAQNAMLSAVVATYVTALGQFVALKWNLRKVVPPGSRSYRPAVWLGVALPIFVVDGFYNLLNNTDILFVSYFLPPDKVAVYFATVKTLALAHFVYFAVKAGTAHRFAAYRAAGDHGRYEEFIHETVRWTFWPSLALAVAMVAFGHYFLLLFGESFLAGEGLLWILAVGIVVRASIGAAATVLIMSGEQVACAAAYGASLFVNVVLNIVLIPRYGLEGAAIATTCAVVFETAALYAAALRKLGIRIFIITLPSPGTRDSRAA